MLLWVTCQNLEIFWQWELLLEIWSFLDSLESPSWPACWRQRQGRCWYHRHPRATAPQGRRAHGPLRDMHLWLGRTLHGGGGAWLGLRRRLLTQRRAPRRGQQRALLLPGLPAAVGGQPSGKSTCYASRVFGIDWLLQEARIWSPQSPLCSHNAVRNCY